MIGGVSVAEMSQLQPLKLAVKFEYVVFLLVKMTVNVIFPSFSSVYDIGSNN